MTQGFLPAFDWQRMVVDPWTAGFGISLWIVVMGFLAGTACGLTGNYLLLRRMALTGDAISHSLLFGLVAAFMILGDISTPVMFGAAVATGVLTVGLIELIHRHSRIKPDAATGIVFTTLFAAGVAMLSGLESRGPVHLDADCVLHGEIAFVPLEPFVSIAGVELGPMPVVRLAGVLAVLIGAIALFHKELLITSFDPGLARSMGIRPGVWHHGLMVAVSIVIVSVFEAVGAILPVAMIVVPPMFAAQMSDRLPARFAWTAVHALASSLVGYQASIWLDCSPAGAMVVAGALLFVGARFVMRRGPVGA
jgi:manganese/zinc/iron transport system permease protein